MRTALEALFDALVSAGWADEVSGDVGAPTGHFARFSLTDDDAARAVTEFTDVTGAYGKPDLSEISGYHLVTTGSDGSITVTTFNAEGGLRRAYQELDQEYSEWGY